MFIICILVIKSVQHLIIRASLTSFAAAIWPMYSPSLKRALGPLFFPENIYPYVNIHTTPYKKTLVKLYMYAIIYTSTYHPFCRKTELLKILDPPHTTGDGHYHHSDRTAFPVTQKMPNSISISFESIWMTTIYLTGQSIFSMYTHFSADSLDFVLYQQYGTVDAFWLSFYMHNLIHVHVLTPA